ncbi:MAG: hypothetical protein ACUVRK_12455, partial [Spirochaetota bacterium]
MKGLPATCLCPQTEYELYAMHNVPSALCNWHSHDKTTVPPEYAQRAAKKHYDVLQEYGTKIIFLKNGAVFQIDTTIR